MNSTLTFDGSYPGKETATRLFDEFDYQAAVQAYVWSISLVNSMGFWKALQRDFGFAPGELAMVHSSPSLRAVGARSQQKLETERFGASAVKGEEGSCFRLPQINAAQED